MAGLHICHLPETTRNSSDGIGAPKSVCGRQSRQRALTIKMAMRIKGAMIKPNMLAPSLSLSLEKRLKRAPVMMAVAYSAMALLTSHIAT